MRISKLKLNVAMANMRLNFTELSKKSGVSRTTLSYINNGKSCRTDVALKIAAALGVEFRDLLEDKYV